MNKPRFSKLEKNKPWNKNIFIYIFLIAVSLNCFAQTPPTNNYEFIFTFEGTGVTTSLVNDMRRDNWAFTDGGQDYNEFYSLLGNSIGNDYNRANYQRLVDYIISTYLYMDLVNFFIYVSNIPMDIATKPEIVSVEFSPSGRLTQIDIKLKFGNYNGTLSISKFPGMFINELNEDFIVEYQQSNNKVHLYSIRGRR
jgi:hypothetical protein